MDPRNVKDSVITSANVVKESPGCAYDPLSSDVNTSSDRPTSTYYSTSEDIHSGSELSSPAESPFETFYHASSDTLPLKTCNKFPAHGNGTKGGLKNPNNAADSSNTNCRFNFEEEITDRSSALYTLHEVCDSISEIEVCKSIEKWCSPECVNSEETGTKAKCFVQPNRENDSVELILPDEIDGLFSMVLGKKPSKEVNGTVNLAFNELGLNQSPGADVRGSNGVFSGDSHMLDLSNSQPSSGVGSKSASVNSSESLSKTSGGRLNLSDSAEDQNNACGDLADSVDVVFGDIRRHHRTRLTSAGDVSSSATNESHRASPLMKVKHHLLGLVNAATTDDNRFTKHNKSRRNTDTFLTIPRKRTERENLDPATEQAQQTSRAEKPKRKESPQPAKKKSKEKKPLRKSRRKGVMCVALSDLMTDSFSAPLFIDRILETIESLGLETEGVYRKAGLSSDIKELIKGLNKDAERVDYDSQDILVLADVVKRFLRQLPQPLMTFELHDEFIAAAELEGASEREEKLLSIVDKLPPINAALLHRLLVHLAKVAEQESVNRMSPRNLAVVFAPCLLRPADSELASVEIEMRNATAKTKCIQCLIELKTKPRPDEERLDSEDQLLDWQYQQILARNALPKTVMGVALSDLVSSSSSAPLFIDRILEAIERSGLQADGVYRKAGLAKTIKELIQGINQDAGRVDYDRHNVLVLADVVKRFLRQLPQPLMTFELHDEFIAAAQLEDASSREVRLLSIIDKLPTINAALLHRLLVHLAKVAEQVSTNRMSTYNLAVVFAPSLLRLSEDMPPGSNDDEKKNSDARIQCVQYLIEIKMKALEKTSIYGRQFSEEHLTSLDVCIDVSEEEEEEEEEEGDEEESEIEWSGEEEDDNDEGLDSDECTDKRLAANKKKWKSETILCTKQAGSHSHNT